MGWADDGVNVTDAWTARDGRRVDWRDGRLGEWMFGWRSGCLCIQHDTLATNHDFSFPVPLSLSLRLSRFLSLFVGLSRAIRSSTRRWTHTAHDGHGLKYSLCVSGPCDSASAPSPAAMPASHPIGRLTKSAVPRRPQALVCRAKTLGRESARSDRREPRDPITAPDCAGIGAVPSHLSLSIPPISNLNRHPLPPPFNPSTSPPHPAPTPDPTPPPSSAPASAPPAPPPAPAPRRPPAAPRRRTPP